MRGPLEQDWTDKVKGLVAWLLSSTASEHVQGPSSPEQPGRTDQREVTAQLT